MDIQDYLIDALEMVLAWDLPEEDVPEAVNAQARLMAGTNLEDTWDQESLYTPLS